LKLAGAAASTLIFSKAVDFSAVGLATPGLSCFFRVEKTDPSRSDIWGSSGPRGGIANSGCWEKEVRLLVRVWRGECELRGLGAASDSPGPTPAGS